MRRLRKAKIVATLGPASSSESVIRALFDAGVDVFRLNFSHGNHDDHRQRVEAIRCVERETGRPIGILMDIQGPKLRLGTFSEQAVLLHKGDVYRLDMEAAPGDSRRAPLPPSGNFRGIANRQRTDGR